MLRTTTIRSLLPMVGLALLVLSTESDGRASSTSAYGQGADVACYIKDRANPAKPGWTMLWKDSAARARGCANALPQCRDLVKRWGGQDVCCTLQTGPDKSPTAKQSGSDACTFERTDHRCGPSFDNARCAAGRCCSDQGWCGGPQETHCSSQHGFDGRFDGP